MANQSGDPRDRDNIPMAGFEVLAPEDKGGHLSPQINITQRFITAQLVQNPRRINNVVAKIREMAMVGSERFYYRWEVKNKDGTKSPVEGLSIKGANSLAMIYGNCSVDAEGRETDTHYYIKATFIDLETGANMTREFRQRKTMDLGKRMDKDRAEDITFQIGQSKAIRNVINNALDPFAAEMLEYAQKGVLSRIEKNPEKAKHWIMETAGKHGVSQRQMELYVARPLAEWTAPHMAKLYGALNAVEDGMETANNIFAAETMVVDADGVILKEGDTKPQQQQGGDAKQQGNAGKPAEGQQQRTSARSSKAKKDEPKPDNAQQAAAQQKQPEEPKDRSEPEVTDDDLDALAGFSGDGN